VRVFKRVWELIGIIKYDTPPGHCPLCGYPAVVKREHYCTIAQAVVTWEEPTDGD
jgi:hypothetical protein